ncbi:MAG: LCP family protein [Anaerovoracaceae bacterium]|jgi:LCP family protein required for cell wall assembly
MEQTQERQEDQHRPTKRDRRRKGRRWLVIVLIIVALLAALVATGVFLYHQVRKKMELLDSHPIKNSSLDIDSQTAKDLSGYRNILLLGIDTREGESDEKCRSDASIIVSINEKTGQVRLISVVRDSYLDLEENDRHVLDKLTHAHAYAGPTNTIRAVNRNLDLNVDDYVRVNWQTVADVVDALDGITVEVKDYEIDEMNKYIRDTNRSLHGSRKPIRHAGRQKLNGIQAVTYCRIRKVGGGDMERAQRMRTVFKCCYSKLMDMNLFELGAFADKVLPEIRTSMTGEQALQLVLRGCRYDISASQGWPYNWDGATIDGVSYDVPITLESNVVKLHKKAFGQKNYKAPDRVREISQRICESSGYYGSGSSGYSDGSGSGYSDGSGGGYSNGSGGYSDGSGGYSDSSGAASETY